jgi:hypothetical protein
VGRNYRSVAADALAVPVAVSIHIGEADHSQAREGLADKILSPHFAGEFTHQASTGAGSAGSEVIAVNRLEGSAFAPALPARVSSIFHNGEPGKSLAGNINESPIPRAEHIGAIPLRRAPRWVGLWLGFFHHQPPATGAEAT